MNSSAPDVTIRLDPDVRDALDEYAREFFPNQSGKGNRTEAARQTLQSIIRLSVNEDVKKALKKDNIVVDGNILAFIRTAVSFYLNKEVSIPQQKEVDAKHTLQ